MLEMGNKILENKSWVQWRNAPLNELTMNDSGMMLKSNAQNI